jgi:hypothetical protein
MRHLVEAICCSSTYPIACQHSFGILSVRSFLSCPVGEESRLNICVILQSVNFQKYFVVPINDFEAQQ